jgi:serine/threonine protein kinase
VEDDVSTQGAKSNPENPLPPVEIPASLPQAAAHPRRMLDRYEIVAEIAKGGMGTVYLARLAGAGGFERLMAIKLMHEHLAEDDAFVTMLLDEARTAANIHHPNAIGVSDVVESPVGYYLVMNYVDGFNLAQIITHGDLTETDRIRLGSRLLADAGHGLHAAHTAKNAKGEKLGIVHRDVSPQNVLVGTDGTARIVDFGIALAASRVAASRPGTLKGKPQYMAPEQARGEPCDPRTDVFALGIILWETLTFERLFFGEMDVAILVQVMDCVVPDVLERNPNAPRALADVAMKALSRWPKDRFASARDFAAALERAAEASGMLASASDVEETVARIFHTEIAVKEEAVRRHLASSTGPIEPLQKGQMGLVQKLLPKKLTPKSAEMATRTGKSDFNSGVRERASDVNPHLPTALATPIARANAEKNASPKVIVEGPRGEVTASVATSAPVERPADTKPGRLGLALGVGGVLLLAAAAAVWALSGGEASEPMTATPLEPRPREVVEPAEPVEPTEVVQPADIVAPVAPIADPVVAEEAQPVVAPVITDGVRVDPVDAVDAPRTHRTRVVVPDVAPEPVVEPVAPPPPEHHTPTVETNPYLTH